MHNSNRTLRCDECSGYNYVKMLGMQEWNFRTHEAMMLDCCMGMGTGMERLPEQISHALFVFAVLNRVSGPADEQNLGFDRM